MPPGKMGSAIELKLFSGIHLLLKVFCFEAFVNRIAMCKNFTQVGVIFNKKYLIGPYW